MLRLSVMAVWMVLLCRAALCQAAPLTFEVASVKRSTATTDIQVTPNGGLHAVVSVYFLMQAAYNIKPFQLLGAPPWLDKEMYQIDAKPPAGTAVKNPPKIDEDLLQRIQSLLADRFHLVVRRE